MNRLTELVYGKKEVINMTEIHRDRKTITAILSKSIMKHLNPNDDQRIYLAREVTFDYMTADMVRVDFVQFKPHNNSVSGIEKGDFFCYEVKSSVEDFHSKNGHNFIGDFNYYVMPKEVYEVVLKEIPYGVGVYTPTHSKGDYYRLECVKKASRKSRTRPASEMLMMMFRSCMRDWRKAELLAVATVEKQQIENADFKTIGRNEKRNHLQTLVENYIKEQQKCSVFDKDVRSEYIHASAKLTGFCMAFDYSIVETSDAIWINTKQGKCVLHADKE